MRGERGAKKCKMEVFDVDKGEWLRWKKRMSKMKKRMSKMKKESEWGGKGKGVECKRRVGKMKKERGLDRKRKYHPSLYARVIL